MWQMHVPPELLDDLDDKINRRDITVILTYLDESGQVRRMTTDDYHYQVVAIPTLQVLDDPYENPKLLWESDLRKWVEVEITSKTGQGYQGEPFHVRWLRQRGGNFVRVDCNLNIYAVPCWIASRDKTGSAIDLEREKIKIKTRLAELKAKESKAVEAADHAQASKIGFQIAALYKEMADLVASGPVVEYGYE